MPKHCWKQVSAWLWLGVACFQAQAATIPFTIAQWRSDTISPQNAVLTVVIAITQTRDGYLWLGTTEGLLRFDGARFTTFNEANTPGLKNGGVVNLFEDSHTNLWIGTETGEVLRVKDGEVKQIQLGRGTRQGKLTSICEDTSGAVWLYTADGYLGQYQGGKLNSWQVTANYQSNRRSMVVDSSGTLWIGTDFVLHRLRPNPSSNPQDVPTIAYSSTPVAELDYLLASKTGGYWRFANGRIQKWNDDRLVPGFDWPYPWNPRTTPIRAACEDSEGNLIAGTGGEGVFWFDSDGKFQQLNSETGLSSDTVLSLFLDRQGDVWVGTDGRGLNRLRRKAFEVLEESRGLTVQSVCPDGHDGLWIGYFGEHIDHWQNGKLDQFRSEQGLRYLGVKSVFVDHEQTLWVGTRLGGLLQLQAGQFEHAPGSDVLTRNYEISALYQDTSNRLWAGTQAGLAQRAGGTWTLVTNGLSGTVVRAILQDRSGTLWVGTQGAGLCRIHDQQFSWLTKTNGLPGDNVSCLYEDGDSVLWIGTSVGLASLHQGKWTSFVDHFSGASGNISYLLDDDNGYLWMGSSVGLLRARKSDLNAFAAGKSESVPVRSYGQSDGLPTRVCSQGSQPAACRTSNGKLWFPTISGLVSLDPGQLKRNTNPPPVIIESVLVDAHPVGSDSLRAPLTRNIVIPAAKESLEIHYTSINLPAPDLGLFKYRLTPLEKNWTTAEPQRRYARYPKLPHGRYTFEVKACNEDGLWNETPAALLVTVLPPFWETWWFITGTSLCVLAFIVGSVHYVSTQKLQRQLAVLRQQEALEKERARIARDLHDQLGANLTQVALLGELAETDKEVPDEVEAHARQISQTARETTRALDEIVWTVNPSNDTLDGLINYVCKYAQEYLALAGLRYRLEVPSDLPPLPITPELRHNVFLATKEAINNVVKHSGANSAWLRLRLASDRFTLEVEDNGKGLPPGADKKGRNGLRNMRKRLEEIGGEFSAVPGHEGGTLVSLTAPLASRGADEKKPENTK
ncbi:MAG TPA: two-component regulator propeller domain-containing protein [Patescibacteria group bacterium]|nr:two-component regulator propeller domain-containing protein [Patescibacteria group bacterium]